MEKLILLITLKIIVSLGDTRSGIIDYAQDINHYAIHPYYQNQPLEHQFQESAAPAQATQADFVPPMDERFGGFLPPPPFPIGVGFGGMPPPPSGFDGSMSPQPQPQGLPEGFRGGPPPNGPIAPPPFGFPDPGFQTQTGFEGLLVPNSWYGLLPWGIEGVIIVIAGIIVFAIIVIAIIGLLAWFCGIKTVLPILKSEGEDAEARSRFGDQWAGGFIDLSANVIEAIEKFNGVMSDEEEEEGLKKKIL